MPFSSARAGGGTRTKEGGYSNPAHGSPLPFLDSNSYRSPVLRMLDPSIPAACCEGTTGDLSERSMDSSNFRCCCSLDLQQPPCASVRESLS